MRPYWFLLTICVAALAPAQERRIQPIEVQRKFALVIGNSAYSSAPLKNPANDAAAMDATLRKLGYEVSTYRDLDLPRMERAIDQFKATVTLGSLAFVYYSGHGLQVEGQNYLLPVDFAAASEEDVKYKAYSAVRLQEKLERSGARLRVMVLDACRNNPFHFHKDAAGGLAAMEVDAEGTLVAFATGDNNTADDNRGGSNGLYTQYLLEALRTPGLTLQGVFQRAKEDVYVKSNHRQNPSIYENIVGVYYPLGPPPGPEAPMPRVETRAADAEAWEAIRASAEAKLFEQFLTEYPSSQYAGAARLKMAALRVPAPVVPQAQPAGDSKVNPKDGQRYVWIPAGKFMMGCSPGDSECRDDEKPVHEVAITKGFWLGQTAVTVGAWKKYVRETGKSMPAEPKFRDRALNAGWQDDRQPIVNVNWEDASAFCGWSGGRLPTEAEWEYAARAGTSGSRYGSLDDIAWYGDNSGEQRLDTAAILRDDQKNYGTRLNDNQNGLHPVGMKQPNAWKLYDMLGNVWQWTADWFSDKYYEQREGRDPTGPPGGQYRALRGGTWGGSPRVVRASNRGWRAPMSREVTIGLRCAGN